VQPVIKIEVGKAIVLKASFGGKPTIEPIRIGL
jgi:hypothetical protein